MEVAFGHLGAQPEAPRRGQHDEGLPHSHVIARTDKELLHIACRGRLHGDTARRVVGSLRLISQAGLFILPAQGLELALRDDALADEARPTFVGFTRRLVGHAGAVDGIAVGQALRRDAGHRGTAPDVHPLGLDGGRKRDEAGRRGGHGGLASGGGFERAAHLDGVGKGGRMDGFGHDAGGFGLLGRKDDFALGMGVAVGGLGLGSGGVIGMATPREERCEKRCVKDSLHKENVVCWVQN